MSYATPPTGGYHVARRVKYEFKTTRPVFLYVVLSQNRVEMCICDNYGSAADIAEALNVEFGGVA